MSNATFTLGILLCGLLVSMILFVLFGQITVKKLRKNPATKLELGMEFASGWDILNVAQSLALPLKLVRKFRESPLSFLSSNPDLLIQHTSKFDRILAFVFYWTYMVTSILLLIWVFLVLTGTLE
ncbi:hypothetical protein SG34_018360 [Thalassomonas viridans]|uniref:Uncharacterized protein n=1 Tax=Thalassomonas viridans TaxID=137584 RepID=A0AAE9YZN5_9GAMM|nr:hypothetical protein [Thalassomonas viridans]WDE03354.1 hypothetical protein SG34_018360 [Thalassomonas viridans]